MTYANHGDTETTKVAQRLFQEDLRAFSVFFVPPWLAYVD